MAPRQRKATANKANNKAKRKQLQLKNAGTNNNEQKTSNQSERKSRMYGLIALVGLLLLVVVVAATTLLATPSTSTSTTPSAVTNEETAPSHKKKDSPTLSTPPLLTRTGRYELLETVPHDDKAFTQGLVLTANANANAATQQPFYYEGTGLWGESELRRVDLHTGNVLQKHALPHEYFGEGISYYRTPQGQGRIVQLTWKKKRAFVYDSDNLEVLSNFTFTTSTKEGWGITYRNISTSAPSFLVSDGSHYLHHWDSATWQETKRVGVHLRHEENRNQTIRNVNELEWDPFTDTLLANVWYQDVLIRIDPDSGFVVAVYPLKTLFPKRPASADVLNGIVTTAVPNEVWVTGKKWPHMFRIRLID